MADEELTDDYVAKLLAKDAKETSVKYSTLGLQAFAQSKPPANKPKPNTRFLRNIIKDTDSHNQALLAREAAEARARLRTLPSHQEEKKPVKVGAGDIRRRQLGDIAAILGGRPSKRKRTEGSGKNNGVRYVNTSSEDEKPEEKPRAKSGRDRESREHRSEGERLRDHRSHRRHRSASEDRARDRKERRKRDRSRSRSLGESREKGSKRRDRSRSPRENREKNPERRHRSPRRKRSRSPEEERSRDKSHRSHRHRRSPSREKRKTEEESKKSEREPKRKPEYDSDPLDDIIGPPPPPKIKIRGRGTISDVSGIDSRFSANYDPTTDVQLDPDEENDWDQALEALRDRQKWKQQGADRLRAAGFTEEEVSKWEKGGEKREADVRWAKQGEGREWDRGKTFDDDGGVKVESSFGRLTDM
ncbi:related to TSM1-component of TFIID complex [Phialocephala subalpina]|uniref:Related to TSM1-component of TFIID complex n=1 Tax=Phialocephala subalpina TaxID=576137 RepID=A0A1L7XFV4_9HELO|nr:related to TSM1-component of TFIID complex [Phialocephala subalpina]